MPVVDPADGNPQPDTHPFLHPGFHGWRLFGIGVSLATVVGAIVGAATYTAIYVTGGTADAANAGLKYWTCGVDFPGNNTPENVSEIRRRVDGAALATNEPAYVDALEQQTDVDPRSHGELARALWSQATAPSRTFDPSPVPQPRTVVSERLAEEALEEATCALQTDGDLTLAQLMAERGAAAYESNDHEYTWTENEASLRIY